MDNNNQKITLTDVKKMIADQREQILRSTKLLHHIDYTKKYDKDCIVFRSKEALKFHIKNLCLGEDDILDRVERMLEDDFYSDDIDLEEVAELRAEMIHDLISELKLDSVDDILFEEISDYDGVTLFDIANSILSQEEFVLENIASIDSVEHYAFEVENVCISKRQALKIKTALEKFLSTRDCSFKEYEYFISVCNSDYVNLSEELKEEV